MRQQTALVPRWPEGMSPEGPSEASETGASETEAMETVRAPRAVWPVRFALAKGASCAAALGAMGLSAAYLFLPSAATDSASLLLALGVASIGGTMLHSAARRAFRFCTPARSMRTLAGCLLLSLREAGLVRTEGLRILIRRNKGALECMLESGTPFERSVFALSLCEMLSPIDNPRYVLLQGARGKKRGAGGYMHSYACPAVMSEPQYAERLAYRLSQAMGGVEAVDTRSPSGRDVLRCCKRFSYMNRGAAQTETRQ